MVIHLNTGGERDAKISCDELGYTLFVKHEREKQRNVGGVYEKTGEKSTEWVADGFYGSIAQAIAGLHRRKYQATAIDSIEALQALQDDFVRNVVIAIDEAATLKGVEIRGFERSRLDFGPDPTEGRIETGNRGHGKARQKKGN